MSGSAQLTVQRRRPASPHRWPQPRTRPVGRRRPAPHSVFSDPVVSAFLQRQWPAYGLPGALRGGQQRLPFRRRQGSSLLLGLHVLVGLTEAGGTGQVGTHRPAPGLGGGLGAPGPWHRLLTELAWQLASRRGRPSRPRGIVEGHTLSLLTYFTGGKTNPDFMWGARGRGSSEKQFIIKPDSNYANWEQSLLPWR